MKVRITRTGFTVIELLVVVSIIGLLVGMLLPAIGKARDQARMTISQANLRNLATAHASYAAEWNDRQFTLIADTISAYGDTAAAAFPAFLSAQGGQPHPPIILGWGYEPSNGYDKWSYPMIADYADNYGLAQPIVFTGTQAYFGSFRLPNVSQFNQYVSGRFYDRIFYAPKDAAVMEAISQTFDDPGEFSFAAEVRDDIGDIPAWSSYCLSPAAMFAPSVFRHDDSDDPAANGFRTPWSLAAGFKSPAMSQARFPDLKTHMLEHNWLQGRAVECNPGFAPGTYDGCEPYYFNHSWVSSPVTLFYDGHVGSVGVRDAMRADGRARAQTGESTWGLWSKDTSFGDNGYLHEYGYDQADSSFHILTTDGIQGRDVTSN
ncbi:MAG: type II secretion system protein [Planctomycetes bacterium]|nr:type II secretion system protein [Planctomycetota bacterium]